jgi:eukaryotic-like serine/threonine-protein kinase
MQQRTDRVRSLASRSRFRIGGLLVQPDRLIVAIDGRDISLEPRIMEVLVALAEQAGETISADQLLIDIWGGAFYGDNPVHRAIALLRKLIGDDSRAPRYVETIRKRGYRLIAPVSFPDDYRGSAGQVSAWANGNPYVGLVPFDDDHAGVFFGRSRTASELMAAIRSQIETRRRFVLIVGASGCGKTSLLRAGAIPLLTQDGGFDGLRTLSVGSCDLAGAHGGDVMASLASALAAWTLGDRPVFPPQPLADLAQMLTQRPESIAAIIAEAFRRYPLREITEQPYAHLLLAIDHAETLVASANIGPDMLAAFVRALHALWESPHTMVAMIARSDFYPKLIETMPELAVRKASDGHLDVLPPSFGEIAQIIRTPAMLAGLSFEEDPQTLSRLDDVLRDAALAQPDALPLLQHTLQALYERRGEAGKLSFQSYRDIGGLEGALAHRAEEVFGALPANAQAQLDAVLAQLIVIQPDSEAVTGSRALWSALSDDARLLVEAFVRARLFVGELGSAGPGFGVAHEALLRQWPRARDWVLDNRRLLQARARLRRATTRWVEAGRHRDHLLNPGQPLDEAREAARHRFGELHHDERDFLRASEHLSLRKRSLRAGATIALIVFSVVSVMFGLLAQRARNEADRRREDALKLTDFMLGDLADKLRPMGNLKLLNSISSEALTTLDPQPGKHQRTEDLINRSRALRTLGEVLMEQAKVDEAHTAFSRADSAARRAVSQAPASVEALEESGIAAFWLGNHHYRQHRLDDASRHWTTYLDSSERLRRLEPDNDKWLVELSYALTNLGAIARDQGRIVDALDYFKRSAVLKERAWRMKPEDDNLRYEQIVTLSWISAAQEADGDLSTAADGYAGQIDMLRALLAKNPDAHAWKRRIANSLITSANLALARGQLEQASAQIEECVALLSIAVAQESGNRTWLRDLVHAHMEAGWIAGFRGDHEASRRHLSTAGTLSSTLLDGAQPLPEWQRLDALVRLRHALTMPTAAGSDAALDLAIADLRRLAAQAPDDLSAAAALANGLIARGQHRHRSGRRQDARTDWRDAAALLARRAPSSNDKSLLAPWISAQILLGRRAQVERQIVFFDRIGYRHPAFAALSADGSPVREPGSGSGATGEKDPAQDQR